LHFRLLVRTAEDDVGGGVYLHWWSEAAAGEPNKDGDWNSHGVSVYVQKYDREQTLTASTSIAAPGLSADIMSSPHRLPLTLAAGVRVLMVIGSCVGCGNANGIPSASS